MESSSEDEWTTVEQQPTCTTDSDVDNDDEDQPTNSSIDSPAPPLETTDETSNSEPDNNQPDSYTTHPSSSAPQWCDAAKLEEKSPPTSPPQTPPATKLATPIPPWLYKAYVGQSEELERSQHHREQLRNRVRDLELALTEVSERSASQKKKEEERSELQAKQLEVLAQATQEALTTMASELNDRGNQVASLQALLNRSQKEAKNALKTANFRAETALKTANFRARACNSARTKIASLEAALAKIKRSEADSRHTSKAACVEAELWAQQAADADHEIDFLKQELRTVRSSMQDVASSNASQFEAESDLQRRIVAHMSASLARSQSEQEGSLREHGQLVGQMQALVGGWSRGGQPAEDALTEMQDLLLFESAPSK